MQIIQHIFLYPNKHVKKCYIYLKFFSRVYRADSFFYHIPYVFHPPVIVKIFLKIFLHVCIVNAPICT